MSCTSVASRRDNPQCEFGLKLGACLTKCGLHRARRTHCGAAMGDFTGAAFEKQQQLPDPHCRDHPTAERGVRAKRRCEGGIDMHHSHSHEHTTGTCPVQSLPSLEPPVQEPPVQQGSMAHKGNHHAGGAHRGRAPIRCSAIPPRRAVPQGADETTEPAFSSTSSDTHAFPRHYTSSPSSNAEQAPSRGLGVARRLVAVAGCSRR